MATPAISHEPLIDTFGRIHDNLRISVTDRCNIRCYYCMPETGVEFMERNEILSFEEIERFVRVAYRRALFESFTAQFASQQARYVRLVVDRRSTLHLRRVAVY